jgi:hypothetical protein
MERGWKNDPTPECRGLGLRHVTPHGLRKLFCHTSSSERHFRCGDRHPDRRQDSTGDYCSDLRRHSACLFETSRFPGEHVFGSKFFC